MSKPIPWLLALALILAGCAAPSVAPTVDATHVNEVSLPTSTRVAATPSIVPTNEATAIPSPTAQAITIGEVIEFEMKGAFDFFWEQANTDTSSPGYGLIRDRFPGSEGIASTASLGFGLTAYLVGVEKGYITYDQAYERVNRTLDTLSKLERTEGFFYHFLSMETGKRAWQSEVSSIDTAILLMGVVTAGQFFGGEIESKARQIYDEVNWPWFIDPQKNMFYMAYRPEKGFEGHWDFYAEQLMLYVLAAGSSTHPMDNTTYYAFTRHKAKYGDGQPFIHSWFGSIFTYQFSHAWIDFRGTTDKEGVNWFNNSVEASLAQYNFAVDMAHEYKTLGPKAWGLTACDGPNGYDGTYGAPPSGFDNRSNSVDDTLAPAGAIGSILFLTDQAEQAMLNYFSIEQLKGRYGFYDAYNLSKNWYDTDVIGIDKGISLLMLANFQDNGVYNISMKNQNILNGLAALQITKGD